MSGGVVPQEPGALAEYLRARRKQLRPEDVGLPEDAGRRVRGLRRAEVAALANISVQYYTRLEQGITRRPSESVLSGLITALALDEHASAYLYRLALPAPPSEAEPASPRISHQLIELVGRWSNLPVVVTDRNQDVLLANDLGLAMFPDLLRRGNNTIEAVFAVSPEARALDGWKKTAHQAVGALRFNANPADARLQQIVGSLSVRDADFRRLWADQHARPLESGSVPVLVDGFGFGDVPWQVLETPGGYFVVVYLATPGTFSGGAIEYLRQRRVAEPTVVNFAEGGTATLVDIHAIDTYLARAREASMREIAENAGNL
jgi:transcriptional regulator with XRE-family HTH domain